MPTQLFYTTQIPVSLWFLARSKKQSRKTLFIDARKLGTMVTRKLRELTDADIAMIADTYKAYCGGTLEAQKGFCAVVDTEEIAKQDYNHRVRPRKGREIYHEGHCPKMDGDLRVLQWCGNYPSIH